jgi:Squalene-hopene cyclase C-terminal domain
MNPIQTLLLWLSAVAINCASIAMELWADDSPVQEQRAAIAGALNFLQMDAEKWRQEKSCSTCHHGTMTIWVQLEAKRSGFAVPTEKLDENVRWVKEQILERVDLPRDTRPGWSMVNTSAMYLALTARAVPMQDSISAADLNRITNHLLRHQEENGSWMWSSAPPKNVPPPFFESDEVATRLACIVLAHQASPQSDDSAAIQKSLALATSWLEQLQPAETTQAEVLRLIMTMQSSLAIEEKQKRIDRLLALQNADGGWAQIKNNRSDAYATGQVLYALSLAGVKSQSSSIQNAVAYLVSTQSESGAWPMTKRTHSGETPSQNLIPITYFGSSWATLGLIRCLPNESGPVP